jgi:hypothetical protein
MAAFSLQVNDGPVLLPLLHVSKLQADRFVTSKPAGWQNCQQRAITFTLQANRVGCLP